MNAPTLLKKLMNRVFATGCNVDQSQFKKISHKIDQSNGDQVVLIEYRYRVKGATPVSRSTGQQRIHEKYTTFPMLSKMNQSSTIPHNSSD